MAFGKFFDVVETHTWGEATRTIVSGLPKLKGNSIAEQMADFEANYDWIRTAIFCEPRGGDIASGAVLLDAIDKTADFATFYLDYACYMPMCGHSTIGITTAAIETGIVKPVEPYTDVRIETPAGIVTAHAEVKNGRVLNVSFENVPCFVYKTQKLDFGEYGEVEVDVTYGGNPFVIVPAKAFHLTLGPGIRDRIFSLSKMVLDKANAEIGFQHPEKPWINKITQIHWYSDPITHPDAQSRSANVNPPWSIDRSPCGTGTSARVTTLFVKNQLALNEEFTQESISGGKFTAKVTAPASVGPYKGGIPVVKGSAWLTGFHKFILDESDPLRYGFSVT